MDCKLKLHCTHIRVTQAATEPVHTHQMNSRQPLIANSIGKLKRRNEWATCTLSVQVSNV